MGLKIDRDRFEEADYARFSARLERSLVALRELLERPGFGVGPASLGTELELFLVDAEGRPLPLNYAVLRETVDPRLTVELDRFNLECNLRPTPLAGRPLSDLTRELNDALAEVRRSARPYGGRVAMIGILPTLRAEDLQGGAMTDTPRFRALAAGLQRLRHQPFRVSIDGEDPLEITCEDVTFEGANTSLQVHLRVDPSAFADTYNAVQLATAPVLAAAANSPTFLGHRLWDETRVALFKQAVDHRPNVRSREARVSFGSGWVTEGAYELLAASVALHEPLLPILSEEDPLEVVRAGGMPRLDEVRLHQGTVWTWNRAIYDPEDGGHLRIEMRGLPAGPGVEDMVANVAFLVGLTLGLAERAPAWIRQIPFETAESNFYRAAQFGLAAELGWPRAPGETPTLVRARDLVLELLPLAKRGLEAAGVESGEIDSRLDLIRERTRSGRTGACWQRRVLDELEPEVGRARALSLMLERYLECGEGELPVHRWPLRPTRAQPTVRVLDAPDPAEVPPTPEEFLRWLGGPSLIRVAGRDRSRTRAVATLIHGNEPSGVRAVHAWLRAGVPPAVDAVLFIGAVDAALAPPGFDHRQLPGAADLNRCFLPPHEGPEGEIASEALRLLRSHRPEALVDLHNNSGRSPPYGVGPRAGAGELELVACFARRFVQSGLRLGALVEATQTDFPSVTIECGCAGDPEADAVARAGLERYLGARRLGCPDAHDTAVEILADPVRVRLRPGVRLAFGKQPDGAADLTMLAEIDRRNFQPIRAGEPIGWLGEASDWPIEAFGADGRDVSRELFEARDGMLRARHEAIPVMMTTDPRIALSDCLFYLVRQRESPGA